MSEAPKFRVGFLLFPNLTQLDLTGPWEVLSGMPNTVTHLIWKTREPVTAAKGMQIVPDMTFGDCPQLDLLCIPGGPGMNPLLTDTETLDFVRRQAKGVRYLTSVCTGSLVLGAAGLLQGKRAASHWMSRELLAKFGAIPVNERVVIDGNIISGGGVTAGIDFGLRVMAEIHGATLAQMTQLAIEYDPAPPFNAGTPATAPREIVETLLKLAAPMREFRAAQADKAAAALD